MTKTEELYKSMQSESRPVKFKNISDTETEKPTESGKKERKMVSIPEAEWLLARAYAYEHRTTITAVISEAVRDYVNKCNK